MNSYADPVVIGGDPYPLADEDSRGGADAHVKFPKAVQGGDLGQEDHIVIENAALGWGNTKFMERGTYNYGLPAILHRRLSWLPGATVTNLSFSTAPNGPTSFCEYWDGTVANRRLCIISPRYVYEIDSAGTKVENDLSSLYTAASRAATWGVLYKNAAMSVPMIFVAVQSTTAAHYMIYRASANVWALSAVAAKHADAIGVVKDQLGFSVLVRIDENGKLNYLTADADPLLSGSWAAAVYPVGEISARTNAIISQSKRTLIGRVSGVTTFDNVSRPSPLVDLESVRDDSNCKWMKEWNGAVVFPSVVGLQWIDGLEYGPCGPLSSNEHARQFRGAREVAFVQYGDVAYAAIYDGADSYVFLGTNRNDRRSGSGFGPFIWHGPVAKATGKQITDITISTIWNKKLWLGYTDGAGWIALNDDFAPTPNATSGYIYLPEGVLDGPGPDVLKEFHRLRYIAPRGVPFDASNTWNLEIDFGSGSGYESAGAAASGSYVAKEWTEKSARRPLARLAYTSNGTAELEGVVIDYMARPEVRWHHTFALKLEKEARKRMSGGANMSHPRTGAQALMDMMEAGWQGLIQWGETELNVKCVDVKIKTTHVNRVEPPKRYISAEFCEVP